MAHTMSEEDPQIRAHNARLIMSNFIPPSMTAIEQPYCIWYPDLATEDTYRELARRYPEMRYQVGRACAVGGYLDLYLELDLLPEVSLAEEARDSACSDRSSAAGADAIFKSIMAKPFRYAVMNDYTRSVNLASPKCPAFLNGDTAVYSILKFHISSRGKFYFDITEGGNTTRVPAGHNQTLEEEGGPPLALEHVPLLYSPLPPDLPTTNKDALILMAAYEGNIDRYIRLRRPVMIADELHAVVRGIYHSTTFARWWSTQPAALLGPDATAIHEAVIARFIMVNDLSRLDDNEDEDSSDQKGQTTFWPMPFLIWYPLFPAEDTLRKLLRLRPGAFPQIAMACALADYRHLWDELVLPADIQPSSLQMLWAVTAGAYSPGGTANRNHYTEAVERWAAERGIRLPSAVAQLEVSKDKEPTIAWVPPQIQAGSYVIANQQGGIYPHGLGANAAEWELYVAVKDGVRRRAAEEGIYIRSWAEDNDDP
ncbi:hypothetical protein BX600DRAFT_464860 [Xylariales sp. PMI_506]|nr:hypothetical protein BX600DRAFT_464860 [Xylariales sp. PMI_506]